ncbi:GntR family transcriptional regulator [Xylophilus sp. GOD-11R]|uniref:GntR family transcriptional regulator n=1 Tax=Xylophilus sp. GOD-11R TaxID=3089814 RepID=UPI00298C6B5A|nr:GntR family transcriptional regulator [Xylophilus sp. GOD-11R]WPB55542.1 GntR family transcriptional regulator [Xylophilus sp. GOD-11R]
MNSSLAFPHMATPAVSAEEEAYQHLLHGIRMGSLRPGERLLTEDIAQSIGMSRMPVREALRRLAAEGLITVRPNRGAVVRGLSAKEVDEVFEMRAALEGLAAARAARVATEADVRGLERLLERMTESEGNMGEWVTLHRQFHESLCRIGDSPRLATQISSLHSVVEPLMRVWLENAQQPARARTSHADIVAALRANDARTAEAIMRRHVAGTTATIVEAMNRQAAGG